MIANINGTEVTLEVEERPLPWQRLGLSYTASGYGRRIPTTRMARFPGETRWRRVFVAIWSNAGTTYIEDRKNRDAQGRPGRIVLY